MSRLPVPRNWEKLRTTWWFGVPIDFMRHKRTRLLVAVSEKIPELLIHRRSEHALDWACHRALKAMGVDIEFHAGRVMTNGQGWEESKPDDQQGWRQAQGSEA